MFLIVRFLEGSFLESALSFAFWKMWRLDLFHHPCFLSFVPTAQKLEDYLPEFILLLLFICCLSGYFVWIISLLCCCFLVLLAPCMSSDNLRNSCFVFTPLIRKPQLCGPLFCSLLLCGMVDTDCAV
uniref:Uncharacterized protein n=1 Tax=Opuntia streptacantha TaxID=393608 RepID=A0A7C9D3J5_OPUST